MGRVLALLCVIAVVTGAIAPKPIPRLKGVPPEQRAKFRSQDSIFPCDQSGIPRSLVQDDYCDCKDQSDEPGTAACPKSKFWCNNAGYRGQFILSSRVNDGVCDCCDGSDEYDSPVRRHYGLPACPNTCAELAASESKSVAEELAILRKGLEARASLLAEATSKRAELQAELDGLDPKIHAAEIVVNALEEEDKEYRAKAEAERKAAEEAKATADALAAAAAAAAADANKTGEVAPAPATAGAAGPTSEVPATNAAATAAPEPVLPAPAPAPVPKPEEPDAHRRPQSSPPSALARLIDITQTPIRALRAMVRRLVPGGHPKRHRASPEPPAVPRDSPAASDAPPIDSPFAEQLSKKRDELLKLRSRRDELNKILTIDFGPQGIYLPYYGRCWTVASGEYTYEVCPFERASQKSHTGTSTSLGTFEGWVPSSNYTVIKLVHGAKCWNGPERSMEVRFGCSADIALRSADEPSMCTYTTVFETPGACSTARAAELEQMMARFSTPTTPSGPGDASIDPHADL